MQDKLPKDREHLVVDNLRLVHYCLKKTFHKNPIDSEYEDYFQEGCIGLILAAMRFDEERGFQFATYAYKMICGSIQRYIRDKRNIIRVPRDKYNLIIKVAKLSSQGFSCQEIEEVTGYSQLDIAQAISSINVDHLDKQVLNEGDHSVSLHEIIADNTQDYEEMMNEENVYDSITEVSQSISNQKWRDIWEEYIYALFYGEKLTQSYFANKYQVSQAQISRILVKYKKQLVKVLIGK